MEPVSTPVSSGTELTGPQGPATPLDTQLPPSALSAFHSAGLLPANELSIAPPNSDSTMPIIALREQMRALQHSMDWWMPPHHEPGEDPLATCIMAPYEAEPPLEHSYPIDDMLDSLSMISAPPPKDPFHGLDLSSFALPAVGAAVRAQKGPGNLESKEAALWTMMRAGDGAKPH